jgi:uncharacterized protein (TIGR03083 family)
VTAETLDTIRSERRLLVERLRSLSDQEWDAPSLCEGWTVRHVLGHLVTPFSVSAPAMAMEVARRRSIGAAMDAVARRLADERSTDELLGTLDENAGSTFRPPGLPLEAPLTDIVVHSADIRWALGDPKSDWGQPDRLRPSLDFVTRDRRIRLLAPVRVDGLSLQPDDQDWHHGNGGAAVRGPSLAILVGLLGRPAAKTELSGEGVARLGQ